MKLLAITLFINDCGSIISFWSALHVLYPYSRPGVGKGGLSDTLGVAEGIKGVVDKISSVGPVPAFPSSYMLEAGFVNLDGLNLLNSKLKQ